MRHAIWTTMLVGATLFGCADDTVNGSGGTGGTAGAGGNGGTAGTGGNGGTAGTGGVAGAGGVGGTGGIGGAGGVGGTLPSCTEPSPAGCVNTGCETGFVCDTSSGCRPSACQCDSDGLWACTADCGGGECVPGDPACGPNPEGCVNTGCEDGFVCDTTFGCRSSSCVCTGELWICTADCDGGECVPEGLTCGPNPAGCVSTGCEEGFVCDKTSGCRPSTCECSAEGAWSCSSDCGGGECVPDPGCGPSPAGCVNTGCEDGLVCDTTSGCRPSVCQCADDLWICTADCDGGECVVP